MTYTKEDMITGDKFIELADYTYSPTDKIGEDYCDLPNTLDISSLKDYDIIYTHTFYVKSLFDIIKDIKCKLIIITHNSDMNVDFAPPDNVIRWFAQNVNIDHDGIESIPIGLENDRWFPSIRKKDKMIETRQKLRMVRNWAYMNHNILTYPSEREHLYDLFSDSHWVTKENGLNPSGFDEYIDSVYNHKFVFCPRGNGMDTHRMWECLYMGSIPIVRRDINNSFYDKFLPILFVDKWEDVTLPLLDGALMKFSFHYNFSSLLFDYWKHKINKYKNGQAN